MQTLHETGTVWYWCKGRIQVLKILVNLQRFDVADAQSRPSSTQTENNCYPCNITPYWLCFKLTTTTALILWN
jgi:hypothetical protein